MTSARFSFLSGSGYSGWQMPMRKRFKPRLPGASSLVFSLLSYPIATRWIWEMGARTEILYGVRSSAARLNSRNLRADFVCGQG